MIFSYVKITGTLVSLFTSSLDHGVTAMCACAKTRDLEISTNFVNK